MGGTILKSQYEIISKLSNRNSAILLLSLVFGGILMRLYFTPFHIPLSLDAIDYFSYAVAMNREGIFPTGYLFSNFGLSTFLSITFLDSNNFEMIELMNIQRIFTILISSFTAIPIYLLSKNFFQREIAILSASLFILGSKEQAMELLDKFKWGHTFYELNQNLLDDYSKLENEQQLESILKDYRLL